MAREQAKLNGNELQLTLLRQRIENANNSKWDVMQRNYEIDDSIAVCYNMHVDLYINFLVKIANLFAFPLCVFFFSLETYSQKIS